MASGYLTDEELELCQTIDQPSAAINNVQTNSSSDNEHMNNTTATKNAVLQNNSLNATPAVPYTTPATIPESLTSPSIKEVLIGGDNNPRRR